MLRVLARVAQRAMHCEVHDAMVQVDSSSDDEVMQREVHDFLVQVDASSDEAAADAVSTCLVAIASIRDQVPSPP